MIFAAPDCDEQELQVISQIDQLRSRLGYQTGQASRWTGQLRRMAFARAIKNSNSIEGINASLDDALAVAEGEQPLDADKETSAALSGYRQAMTYVLQLSDDPHFSYTEDLIRGLHFIMLQYDLNKSPGRWRPGHIYVRDEATQEIVYEGPEADRIPELVQELIGELNVSGKDHALVRGAMAHLNLVLIHPFRDGNGRMARCLQTLVLAREGILAPQFSSIEEYLGHNTSAYYDILAKVGKGYWQPGNDARPWIRFSLTAHYRQAQTLLRRVRESSRLWEVLDKEVTDRGLPERMLIALFDAASGFRVRNATYRSAAGDEVSEQTASRDLRALVDAGLLIPQGERRGRFYTVAPLLKEHRQRTLEPKVPIPDPFETHAATAIG